LDQPLYLTISEDIRKKIRSGALPYGQKLPSERELAENYEIDRKTLRKAISILIDEGLLESLQGKGTYITQQAITYRIETLDNLAQTMTDSGIMPATRLLYKEKRAAGPKYARLLEIDPGDEVLRIVRLRLGDGEPLALQDTYVPVALIPNIEHVDFEMYSLYSLFRKQGIALGRVDESFSFVRITDPEARILGMTEGSLAFVTEDLSFDQAGAVMEFTKSLINNAKLKVSMGTP